MTSMIHSRLQWYIERRLEYLRNRRDRLKSQLDVDDAQEPDLDILREFLETVGRIRELEHLLSSSDIL